MAGSRMASHKSDINSKGAHLNFVQHAGMNTIRAIHLWRTLAPKNLPASTMCSVAPRV
jgi:hypothetical protein